MTSKTISVKEEVYDMLEKEKLPKESFSDTLTRLIKDKGKISDLAGAWSDLDEKELESIEKGMKKVRGSADERVLRS
ncbi:MAG: antitoxin VapB family protein [Candidatus Thermoplasmatota archaeon]|nr:antitoxin VapB family protein [Candidatus Thermoplasmatota archaeon]